MPYRKIIFDEWTPLSCARKTEGGRGGDPVNVARIPTEEPSFRIMEGKGRNDTTGAEGEVVITPA
jgi:hypothetical protein